MALSRRSRTIMLGMIGLAVLSGTSQAAVTEDNFISKSTGDLVALCTAAPTDRLYTAAVNFCHGFGAGTYAVLASAQQADPKLRLFCSPPNVTRNEAIAAFVSWAGARPDRMTLSAVDGIAGFLTETYPCPTATGTAATGRAR